MVVIKRKYKAMLNKSYFYRKNFQALPSSKHSLMIFTTGY